MKPVFDLSDDDLARLARRAVRELPDAPQWLIESAVAIWRAPSPRPSLRQRIVATLGFDSWLVQPTLAMRSTLRATRQLLFTAQGRDIDLRVSPAGKADQSMGLSIAGQVLGPGEVGDVSLIRDGRTVDTVSLDDFGEFRFGGLEPGPYTLWMRFVDVEIVLPPIDIGDASQR